MSDVPDDHEIHLTNRKRVAISGMNEMMDSEDVHQVRATQLVYGVMLQQARYMDDGDEYGVEIWNPNGHRWMVEIDGRTFEVNAVLENYVPNRGDHPAILQYTWRSEV